MRSLLGIHKLNPAVRILIYSDVLMISGWGLVEPLFAVYVTDQIKGASLELIGIATADNSITTNQTYVNYS